MSIESGSPLRQEPGKADALARRADVQFALLQSGEAIANHGTARRLRPEDEKWRRRRAKTEGQEESDAGAARLAAARVMPGAPLAAATCPE